MAVGGITYSRNDSIKYGELVVLGTNVFIPCYYVERERTKFVLFRRQEPNGVKRSKQYVVESAYTSDIISKNHFISCQLHNSKTHIIEYTPDEQTDMFQIGRSNDVQNDFVVPDPKGSFVVLEELVSSFACRILIDRHHGTHVARLYAGGFDSSKRLCLRRNATTWADGEFIDGLAENGVWIKHPGGKWYEVSICGDIFTLRKDRSTPPRGDAVDGVNNVLQDGTLIDLCGVTLLWRSTEGLSTSPTKVHLEDLVQRVNAGRFLCPVDLSNLVIDYSLLQEDLQYDNDRQPYIYLNCGHLQSNHRWGRRCGTYTCAVCKMDGPIVMLRMGMEYAFYREESSTDLYAFNPCGHTATCNTVCYWTTTEVPIEDDKFHAVCPFCYTPLSTTNMFTRLYFS